MRDALAAVSRLFNGNTKRFEEVHILNCEGFVLDRGRGVRRFELGRGLLFQLIEADGRFQHQQDVKPLLANVFHHASDVLRLGNAFMYGFAQLLDKVP